MANDSRETSQPGQRFRVGDWLVESSLNRISRDDGVVRLELRSMDVLVFLAERAGEVVSRAELQDAVWRTECVSFGTIVGRICELREARDDDARQPRYIETIPKKGYRLIAPVSLAHEVEGRERGLTARPPAHGDHGLNPGHADSLNNGRNRIDGRGVAAPAVRGGRSGSRAGWCRSGLRRFHESETGWSPVADGAGAEAPAGRPLTRTARARAGPRASRLTRRR